MADRPEKEAARCGGTENVFTRIPESTLYQDAREENRHKWQREWTASQKASVTRQFIATIQDRLSSKLKLTQKISTVLTGHGKTKA